MVKKKEGSHNFSSNSKYCLTIGIIAVVVLIAIILLYLIFFRMRVCDERECFDDALRNCDRASYINDEDPTATWNYEIQGRSGDECEVKVNLLQVKEGRAEMERLEDKSMVCNLHLGMVTDPESNLGRCKGILREEMQTIIINRLHKYIMDNIGKIDEGLRDPLEDY